MTYLNRLTEDSALLPLVETLPRVLRRGEDYWAIFVGTFTPEEMITASRAHYIDGPLVECWLEWYIQNNHYFQDYKRIETGEQATETVLSEKPEIRQDTANVMDDAAHSVRATEGNTAGTEQEKKVSTEVRIKSRVATELETHLSNEEMQETFGPDFGNLFNGGEGHHIATSADGLQPNTKTVQETEETSDATHAAEVPIQYSRTGFMEKTSLEESDSEDEADEGYASQKTGSDYVLHVPLEQIIKRQPFAWR